MPLRRTVRELGHDVDVGEHQRAVRPADDVPHRELAHEIRPHHREDDRVPSAARPADRDDLLDSELLHHQAQRLRPHVRLGATVELHVGLAAVGTVPEQHPLAAFGERVGELVDAAEVLAEAAPGSDDDDLAVLRTDELVDDDAAVDLDLAVRHGSPIGIVRIVLVGRATRPRRPGRP